MNHMTRGNDDLLIRLAARKLLAAIAAELRGDIVAVQEAREVVLRAARIVGPPFVEMLVSRTALNLVETVPRADQSFRDAESKIRARLERLLPELRVGPACQFGGTA